MTGPQTRGRWGLIIWVTSLVLLTLTAVVVRFSDDHRGQEEAPGSGSGASSAQAASTDAAEPAPAVNREAASPSGFARDEDGAAAAAVEHVAAGQKWLYLSDDELVSAVADIAAPDAVDDLSEDIVDDVRLAREELSASPGRVWWFVHPLAWQVDRFSEDAATVSVWVVTILSAVDVTAPQAEWMTVTVDLEWVDGGWRLREMVDRPGPTPMTNPSDRPWESQRFDDHLEDFTRLDEGGSA